MLKAKQGDAGSSGTENMAKLELAQMRNVQKRIDIYRHELEKLKSVNTASVVQEYPCLHLQTQDPPRHHPHQGKVAG